MVVDFDGLEDRLRVLCYANRLKLLHMLCRPMNSGDIELEPSDSQAGDRPDRAITRQAVQNHIQKLADLGLVRAIEHGNGRRSMAYVVEPTALYDLAEQIRDLASIRPDAELDPAPTAVLSNSFPSRSATPGAHLVVAHGARVGEHYPLEHRALKGDRGWVIGRGPSVHVDLDYDAAVAREHAEILDGEDGFRVLRLRSAPNDTYVNWEKLPLGGDAELAHGDIIGVGRSVLVFREK